MLSKLRLRQSKRPAADNSARRHAVSTVTFATRTAPTNSSHAVGLMSDQALPILFENDRMIAINKPSGLLVHRSNIDRHETRFAVQMLRDQIGRRVYPVHRLDKGTSGVLLFGLDATVTRLLGRQFTDNRVQKTYLAVVRGWPAAAGVIDHALTHESDPFDAVNQEQRANPPQAASTEYRSLAQIELAVTVDRYPSARYALVELKPLTGRRHQLRRHMKHIDHPIIGDSTHGKGRHNRYFQQAFDCHRMLLTCVQLRLLDPATERALTITAPLGDQFAALLERFNWSTVAAVKG